MGRPPPIIRAMPERKRFFSIEVFPKFYRFAAIVAITRMNVEAGRKFDPFRRKVIYLWRFVVVDPAAVEEEAQRGDRDAHLRGGDIVVVSNLELQVTLSL